MSGQGHQCWMVEPEGLWPSLARELVRDSPEAQGPVTMGPIASFQSEVERGRLRGEGSPEEFLGPLL